MLLPAVLIALAGLAYGQDAATGGGMTAPPNPLGWVKFVLDLGVPGVLAVGIYKLWGHYRAKESEWQADRKTWADEKAALKEEHEKETDRIWAEARKDKSDMRAAVEAEKTQMRTVYTDRIDALQEKHDREQKDRREEAERLLREQNVLTREVMETAQAMAESLRENTRVVERFNDSIG